MKSPRKHVGVFVPPPAERASPLGERIARIRGRVGSYEFLDAEPLPDKAAVERQRAADKDAADWERRRQEHIAFLSGDVDEYLIRTYIQNHPYDCCGPWHGDSTDDEGNHWPAGWSNAPLYESNDAERKKVIQRVRQHIIDVFREFLKDVVCPHGESWEVWEAKFKWSAKPGAGCERCRVEHELRGRGYKHDLETYFNSDAKDIKTGNTKNANTVLAMLGHSLWAGANKEETSGGNDLNKLTVIDAAHQRDQITGGKRATASGHGPDSDDALGTDFSSGSQISSREPNYLGRRSKRELGITTDVKKIRAEYRELVEGEEREESRKKREFSNWTDAAIDKEIRKRVRVRMKAEFKDHLKWKKGEEVACLPIEASEVSLLGVIADDNRKTPALSTFDSETSLKEKKDGEVVEVPFELPIEKTPIAGVEDEKTESEVEEVEIDPDSETYDPNLDPDLQPEEDDEEEKS